MPNWCGTSSSIGRMSIGRISNAPWEAPQPMTERKPRRRQAEKGPTAAVAPVSPVVGIGASAGGIEALKSLVPAIEADSGLAYVIVQHLDPDRESVLAQLLSRVSGVSVSTIEDGTQIQADHIYV